MNKYYIYKYVDKNNNIVYIGQTVDLKQRYATHKNDDYGNEKCFYFECENKAQMDNYEYLLIRKYRPKYNKQYNENLNNDIQIELIEPIWIDIMTFLQNHIEGETNIFWKEQYNKYKNYRTDTHRRKSRIDVDKNLFIRINRLYETGQLTGKQAYSLLGIGKTSFQKLRNSAKEYFNDDSIEIHKKTIKSYEQAQKIRNRISQTKRII